uniref:Uncharacterized protein n=1 Tax=Anopheles atroparvus TaxID=41427 RepID=A0AAG5D572_ANOAO
MLRGRNRGEKTTPVRLDFCRSWFNKRLIKADR